MKFIRNYKTAEDFERCYGTDGEIIIITTAITCDLGVFVYDRVETGLAPFPVYIWVKDGVELATLMNNPQVGDEVFDAETGQNPREITAVDGKNEFGYFEPWIGLSPGIGGVIADGMRFEYYGEMQRGNPD